MSLFKSYLNGFQRIKKAHLGCAIKSRDESQVSFDRVQHL